MAQQSVFLIGDPLIPKERTTRYEVPANLKENVVRSLSRMGLSRRALFGDVPGLAAMNGPTVPLRKPMSGMPTYQKESGDLAYQERRFDDALLAYHAFAASNPRIAEPQCLLGDTLAALGRHEEAVEAYTDAERHIETPVVVRSGERVIWEQTGRLMLRAIHYNRGNARAVLGDHADAVADFGAALELDVSMGFESPDVRYNRANSRFELGDYAGAFEDYRSAKGLMDSSDALLGMGNCQIMLAEFGVALRHFEHGAREGGTTSEACQRNAHHTQEILAVVKEREFDVVRQGRDLELQVEGLPVGTSGLIFVGSKGNVGNTPSAIRNAPGGEGYGGARPFIVRFVEKRVAPA